MGNSGERLRKVLRQRAVALSQPLEEKVEKKRKMVTFSLADEWYGLDASQVKEVLRAEKITLVPGAPPHIRGVINLRGEITSVTDPKRLLGLKETPLTDRSYLIVVEVGKITTALLVDSVAEITEVPQEAIEPPLTTFDKGQMEYLRGEVPVDSKLLAILNLETLIKEE